MKPFNVALVSDLLEEKWPSMDLVSDMLFAQISKVSPSTCCVSQLRPPMRRRFSILPAGGNHRFSQNADRLINRFYDYPRWLRRRAKQFHLFHLVDHSYSHLIHELPLGRTVVTCHDLDTFRCLFHPAAEPRSWQFRQMARRILSGLSKAAHVLCVSETVRQEVLQYGILPADRLTVIYNGMAPCFTTAPSPAADAEAARLVGANGGSYLLSVGSNIARKRLDHLLRVFASVRKVKAIHLVRVGGAFTGPQQTLVDELELGRHITVLPFVSRAVLASIYRSAALLLLTSDAEGFGLPLVEAMSCGCPTVASDIPVLREVGGQAPVFCPVGDLPVWSETITNLLAERLVAPEAWNQRRKAGSAWAARFRWEQSAARYVESYTKVLEGRL